MSKCPTKDQLYQDFLSDLSWFEIAEKYGYTDSRFLRKKPFNGDCLPVAKY